MMRTFICLVLSLLSFSLFAQTTDFHFYNNKGRTAIYVSPEADELIRWAADDFAEDLSIILGYPVSVKTLPEWDKKGKHIVLGQVQHISAQFLPTDIKNKLDGKWEAFTQNVIDENTLCIAGSDIRGTVYGLFDLAEKIGISPWKWWADVVPQLDPDVKITLANDGEVEEPAVQFRGIFLNDEDWGLQPWAAKTFEPEVGDIGPQTYEKIFQLLLRLKANTIWPAMHPCTKAFFTIAGNRAMADRYHIVVGTSHAEPMLRNNVGEWKKEFGEYNYAVNAEKVKQYWEERVAETQEGNNYLYTVGMRGIHDSGMRGAGSAEEKKAILAQIIADQRDMLSQYKGVSAEEVPQVFIPYKEVLSVYNDGLELPDDITLMWTDDNYGYIRRRSEGDELARSGGSGVYYHLSYWGRPHDYLWLPSTSTGLMWYEMSRAYHNGAQKIWIANVGDIKPLEYSMEFFLDLAWDAGRFESSQMETHSNNWYGQIFGEELGAKLSAITQKHFQLSFLRKPEFMAWSQTEPTTGARTTGFSSANGELQRRMDAYQSLYDAVEGISQEIPETLTNAYFELIKYPIQSAALMNLKWCYAQLAAEASDETERTQWAGKSKKSYDEIAQLTDMYNQEIADGKWSGMMDMHPRDLPVFKEADYFQGSAFEEEEQVETSEIITKSANDTVSSASVGRYHWQMIDGLGYSQKAMTLMPLAFARFEDERPALKYDFGSLEPGKYVVEIRCLPTHSNHFDHELGIKVNNATPKFYRLNTKGRSDKWKNGVLQNFIAVKHLIEVSSGEVTELELSANQTGIVIDQIAIYPENAAPFYEIPTE